MFELSPAAVNLFASTGRSPHCSRRQAPAAAFVAGLLALVAFGLGFSMPVFGQVGAPTAPAVGGSSQVPSTPAPTIPGTTVGPNNTQQSQGQTQQTQQQSQQGTRNQQQNQTDNQRNRTDDPSSRRDTDQNRRRNAANGDQPAVPFQALTEFQRLVAESTGSVLPIFGSNLFGDVPSTFAPVDDIPVTPDYVVGPGDEIRLQLYGQVNQQGSYVVDRTGDISYPNVGTLHVAGLRFSQLESFLRAQLSRVYRNFDLNVNLGQLRSIQVFVVGQARQPGSYTISSLSTLLNALFASGGPTGQGSLRDIQVRRGAATVTHFDLYDLLLRGDKTKDIKLEPGDVIFIPTVGRQVAVAGSVNTPAIYEVLHGAKVSDVVALASGPTNVAVTSKARLERIFEHTMRSIVDLDFSQGQNPEVADGDIITVSAILDNYKDAVTLRGNVASPGRYVWHPGLRILDVVPNQTALITRDFYHRRNTLGNTGSPANAVDGAAPLALHNTLTGAGADYAEQTGTAATPNAGGNSVGSALTTSNSNFPAVNDVILVSPDIDWTYAVIERLDPRTLTTLLIPFNPGRLYKEGDQTQNLPLEAGDIITFFSIADVKTPIAQQTRVVRLEGEFGSAGVYLVQPGETLRQLLRRAGGFTPEAYLFGSEFTRQSTRRLQQQRLLEYADSLDARISAFAATSLTKSVSDRDSSAVQASVANDREVVAKLRRVVPLGRIVLELKPDSRTVEDVPDLALEDGDRFVVPHTPATVTVEGQVYSANAFLFERGKRASSYLRMAGGPDRTADSSRTFVLRADGSIYSGQYGKVSHANIFPGDTVVVPPSLSKRAFLRDLLDFSSIAGQFGLAAAAVNVLK